MQSRLYVPGQIRWKDRRSHELSTKLRSHQMFKPRKTWHTENDAPKLYAATLKLTRRPGREFEGYHYSLYLYNDSSSRLVVLNQRPLPAKCLCTGDGLNACVGIHHLFLLLLSSSSSSDWTPLLFPALSPPCPHRIEHQHASSQRPDQRDGVKEVGVGRASIQPKMVEGRRKARTVRVRQRRNQRVSHI